MKAGYPDANIQLIKGGGGIFDVKLNGKRVYSKQNMKDPRFPDEGEIIRLIKEAG